MNNKTSPIEGVGSSTLCTSTRFFTRLLADLRVAFALSNVQPDVKSLFRPASGHIIGLDIARAMAVILAICDHFAYGWNDIGLPKLALLGLPMFRWGWTRVDLFFVLSGCLIGQQLWREVVKSGHVRVWRFIVKRGFRIWPLYFTTLLVILICGTRFSPVWADWFFLSNYISGRGFVRGWSLSTEEQFYILTPLVFLMVGRFRSTQLVAGAFAAGLVAVPLARVWTSRRLHEQGFTDLVISAKMYSPFHLHSEALIVGLLLAFAYTCVTPGHRARVW